MPQITAIETKAGHKTASVCLEGAASLILSLELVASHNLRVGDTLAAGRLRSIETENLRLTANAAALRLIAIAPRTRQDLVQRLRRRGLPKPIVDAAVERMEQLGYLDDGAFARSFVEARQASTPKSRRALRFELVRKGVSSEIAAHETESLSDENAAYEAAQRRLRALRGLDQQAFARRLGSFLGSRGFSYSVARSVIDRCWSELDLDDGDGPAG